MFIALAASRAASRDVSRPSYASSAASAFSFSRLSGFMADKSVTVFSANVISLPVSSFPRITFAATGAQEPFSISHTVRFW